MAKKKRTRARNRIAPAERARLLEGAPVLYRMGLDSLSLLIVGSPYDRGRCPASGSISTVRSLIVVEPQGAFERSFDLPNACEVLPSKLDPPVFVKQRAVDALDEAIRERMAGLGPGLPNTECLAGASEVSSELAAAIRENALEGPVCALEIGMDLTKELRRDFRSRVPQEDLGPSEGGGRIAGRDLPDLADALELSNEEAVEAD